MARRARLVVLVVVLLFVAIAAAVAISSEEAAPAAPASSTELAPPVDDGHTKVDYQFGVTLREVQINDYLGKIAQAEQAAKDEADRQARVAAAKKAAASASRGGGRGRSAPSGGSHRGYATWWECTSMVENHGDYGRSSNRTHFGRYQFSRGTWAAYGGDPATWGSASPEEQDRVFQNAIDKGGESNWRPYNGC